jgi:hypothetical protein
VKSKTPKHRTKAPAKQQRTAPLTRDRREKRIAALAKRGKIHEALKLARGWQLPAVPHKDKPLTEEQVKQDRKDRAGRIVDQWQAVGALEKNPALEHGAPAGFSYRQIVERAGRVTCSEVRRAILSCDAEFFIRIAERIRQAEPNPDALRVAVLSDLVTRQSNPERGRSNKEIASEIGSRNIESNAHKIARLRRAYGRDK